MPSRARRAVSTVAVDTRPLRESREFRRLFTGQSISLVGRQITIVAVPYQIFQLTHSPLLIGVVGVVQAVPLVLVSVLAGSLADRRDRRTLLLVTQMGLALTSAALAIVTALGAPPVLLIYGLVALAAGIGAIDSPTRTAMIPNIVKPDHLTGALALNFGLFQASMIAGPAVAGLVLAHSGIAVAYAIDACTFIAALISVWLLPAQPPMPATAHESRVEAMVRGFRFVRRQPVILGGFALDLVAMIFGLPTALFPVLAANVFHIGVAQLGLLYAAPGVGAVLAAATAGWVGRARHQGRIVIIAVGLWGIAITGFGLTSTLWLGLVFLALAGAFDCYSAVARNTMMQTLTPDDLRGRLTAVYYMVVVGGPRFGDLEAGAVATAFTPRVSVVSGGLLCVVGMACAAAAFPALWAYRAAMTSTPSESSEVAESPTPS